MTIKETLKLLHRREQGLDSISNSEFAETDQVFKKACELAGVPPSSRQASKYRNNRGLAYDCAPAARIALSGQPIKSDSSIHAGARPW